ncbi:hypothetical protein GE061_003387 [Apolygus lucorum]|uniref:PiggyBac transposable element-derived protein 4 C-terminal zinc-finger domain-containing protein n=1 Tax=Apolygus lucorum TaxID=248454 RepID=A0A8S9X4G6_APOLU|nr:hypothetical protein GE061_003387 [Apolygus lucorum]
MSWLPEDLQDQRCFIATPALRVRQRPAIPLSLLPAQDEIQAQSQISSTMRTQRINFAGDHPHFPMLETTHFPCNISALSIGTKKAPLKRCRICHRRGVQKRTRYYCPGCPSNPGLCVESCFLEFHANGFHY